MPPFEQYNLSCYILDRLLEVGCEHLFGVPGDYNLRFLDDAMTHDMKWVGCANELNMAYAADGYARMRGIAAMISTYGVGELSAMNGFAGSSAESVPVVQIAGAPCTNSQKEQQLVHHSLGDGGHLHFQQMNEHLCCAAVMLTRGNAVEEVDRVITDVLYYKKPGYIALPTDLADMRVEPPTGKLFRRTAPFSSESVEAFRTAATAKLAVARNPAVLVGHYVERHGLSQLTEQFLQDVRVAYAVAILGKGAVPEHLPNFVGTFLAGPQSNPAKSIVESADTCILLGVQLTDLVTGNFTHKINMDTAIEVNQFSCRIGGQYFQVPLGKAIEVLRDVCPQYHDGWCTAYPQPECLPDPGNEATFDAAHFWREFQRGLRPNDIIVVDLGTSAFTSLLLRLPKGARYISQQLWAAIGYSIPASLGVQLSSPDRRVLCVVGDGAAQMTVQEIGTFPRNHLATNFFLMNNSGYTIERYIRGTHAAYNDISQWNWKGLVQSFCMGANPEVQVVRDIGAVSKVMATREGPQEHILFAEVLLDMMDGLLCTPIPFPVAKPSKKA